MSRRKALFALGTITIMVAWLLDRKNLRNQLTTLQQKSVEHELLHDPHEIQLLDRLKPGDTLASNPGIETLADDISEKHDSLFVPLQEFLVAHWPELKGSLGDCVIYSFDVSYQVIGRGGAYCVITRDGVVSRVLQLEATIGIPESESPARKTDQES